MERKYFVVVQDVDGTLSYATNVSGLTAKFDDIQQAELMNLPTARRLCGALLQFSPDFDFSVKEVNVTISLL